jgi:excisionase family DNA binding protein
MGIDCARATREQAADRAIEPLMTADEVAAALGVNRRFVYARAAAGALRGYKLGPRYRFRPEDVRAFVEASLASRDAPRAPRAGRGRSAPAGSFRALLDRRAA